MGRHSAPSSTPRRKPVAPIAAAAALALVGLGGGGYAALRTKGDATEPTGASSPATPGTVDGSAAPSGNASDVPVDPAASSGSGAPAPGATVACAKGGTVTVSTTPDMAPALRAVADDLKKQGSDCVTYDISELAGGVLTDRIVEGKKTPPQIWVPDSPVWIDEFNEETQGRLQFGSTVATSPVGLVVPKFYVDRGAKPGPFPWAALMETRKHAVTPAMSDPAYSTASMLMLSSATKAATDSGKKEAVKAEVMLMAQNPRSEDELMQLAASGSPLARSFPASEQQMRTEHKIAPDQKVAAVTIAGGTPQLAYGVVPMGTDSGAREAANALRAALVSDAGKAKLVENGFRVPGTPSEKAPSDIQGFDMTAAGTLVKDPNHDEFHAVTQAWTAVNRKMRLILAVDASGSMRQPANPKMSRIQLASGISLEALRELKGNTEVGVWAFSDQTRGHGTPWVEMAAIKPLDAKAANGRTHREDLIGVAKVMPSLPNGGTALYDTVLAAVKRVQASYDKNAVNSVVVWTDGVNRDAATITKDELLAQLKAVATSDRPVRVVLVGMGQASDMTTLTEIAKSSGGSAYYAHDPAAVKSIIVGALTARLEQSGAH